MFGVLGFVADSISTSPGSDSVKYSYLILGFGCVYSICKFINQFNLCSSQSVNQPFLCLAYLMLTMISIGNRMGPSANTESSPPMREYINLVPAASYAPGALIANSPFIIYDPFDIFNAVNR